MARHKPVYHCAICGSTFKTKDALGSHTANHADSSTSTHACPGCEWTFNDSHALEVHMAQAGHGTLAGPSAASTMAVYCDRCQNDFSSQKQFNDHRSNMDSHCADWRHTPPKKKKNKNKTKPQQQQQQQQAPHLGRNGLDAPNKQVTAVLNHPDDADFSDTPSDTSDGGKYCRVCEKTFNSQGHYNNHMLGCTPVVSSSKAQSAASKRNKVQQAITSAREQCVPLAVNYMVPEGPRSLAAGSRPMPTQTVIMNTRPPLQQQQQKPSKSTLAPPQGQSTPKVQPQTVPSVAPEAPSVFICNVDNCRKVCRSAPGLAQHKIDVHGIGGQKLDMTGRDTWMLGQRERERLKSCGLLQQPSGSPRGRGGRGGRTQSTSRPFARPACPSPPGAQPYTLPPIPPSRRAPPVARPSPAAHPPPTTRPRPAARPPPVPTSSNMGGAAEMEQAMQVQGQILPLLIQSDIFIKHDGKMNVCGIDWVRIAVSKQKEVFGTLDGMCHLPKILQCEYLPAPKAFKDEYTASYPYADFKPSPTRDLAKPGLGVVALSCSKVVLADGREEVVKIAAVDLVTCRILMNHLVCTDPQAEVIDWRLSVTGMFSWRDMEGARQAGYKVFKGWSAARSALWKWVDKDTIIVGHNLRSDLDALRIVHGRAVDIAKIVEKAANGPLNKTQLGLDSLSRDYPSISLKSDPEYGRDVLMNALAVREFALWSIKNQGQLRKVARQRSVEFQVAMPKAAAAV
ncbi:hypothetical protein BDW02DRAFT_568951 [Decorospora gaudefroyi]|uniref:C2H2-type domain-containing protein n=1 Tax=Decorospora gaudefroyi TaxID=184978 RepID=A0A6A5KG02_9PLEO|nr:hypothetical protein BDW02DRAFT_568951 [Decorospora gaudefroyi]